MESENKNKFPYPKEWDDKEVYPPIEVSLQILNQKRNVVESNKMVEAYMDLNMEAQKILYTTIAMIGQDDKNFFGYTFKVSDLQKFFGSKSKRFYERVKKAIIELMQCVVVVVSEDGEKIEPYHVVKKATYDHGELYIKLDEEIADFFLQLKKNFTKVPLNYFLELGSPKSMRVLNLVMSRWNIATGYMSANKKISFKYSFDISVNTIRHMFFYGVKNSTADFKNIKTRLLIPTVNELNEKSSFKSELSYIKRQGNTIDKVRFHVELNERGKLVELKQKGEYETDSMYLDWREGRKICRYFQDVFQIPPKEIFKLHQKYDNHELKAAYLSLRKYLLDYSDTDFWEKPYSDDERGVIKSPIAMLTKTLQYKNYNEIEELEFEGEDMTIRTRSVIDKVFEESYPFSDDYLNR